MSSSDGPKLSWYIELINCVQIANHEVEHLKNLLSSQSHAAIRSALPEEEIDPNCPPLSQRKSSLRSFPTIESYSQDVLERQSRSTLGEGSTNRLNAGITPRSRSRSRLGLPVAAKIVGRLSLIHKFVRASRAAEVVASIPIPSEGGTMSAGGGNGCKPGVGGGRNGDGDLQQEANLINGKALAKSAASGRTAQFAMMAPPVDGKEISGGSRRPSDTLAVPDANLSRSSMSSSRTGLRVPDMARRDSFDLHMRHVPAVAERFQPAGAREEFDGPRGSFEGRGYHFPTSSGVGFYGEEDAYFDYRNNPDGYYYANRYRQDPPMYHDRPSRAPSRHSSRHSEYDGSPERGERSRSRISGMKSAGVSHYRHQDLNHHPYQQQQQQQPKQVRFQEYREFPLLNSDSSFSDGDEGVEHLYQAPSVASRGPGGVQFTFGSAGEELVEGYSRSARKERREKEYFNGFESDHSNYPNSREASPVDEGRRKGGHPRVVKHRPPLPRSVPRVVTTVHDDNDAGPRADKGVDGPPSGRHYVLHEPYGNVPVYPTEPEPAPQPLPRESFGMLRRYLEYFGHPGEEEAAADTTGDGSVHHPGSSRGRPEEDWGYQSNAATSNTERHYSHTFSMSGISRRLRPFLIMSRRFHWQHEISQIPSIFLQRLTYLKLASYSLTYSYLASRFRLLRVCLYQNYFSPSRLDQF